MSLPWPDYLQHSDGELRFVGSRISYSDVLRLYLDLAYSAEMIASEFPAIELSTVHKFLAFYLEHADLINPLLSAEKSHNDAARAAASNHLSLAELRRRATARPLTA